MGANATDRSPQSNSKSPSNPADSGLESAQGRRQLYLTSFRNPYTFTHPVGELAQLGERLHGMQEVRGSSPLFSIGRRPIESRQEKVESRKIGGLEIF